MQLMHFKLSKNNKIIIIIFYNIIILSLIRTWRFITGNTIRRFYIIFFFLICMWGCFLIFSDTLKTVCIHSAYNLETSCVKILVFPMTKYNVLYLFAFQTNGEQDIISYKWFVSSMQMRTWCLTYLYIVTLTNTVM